MPDQPSKPKRKIAMIDPWDSPPTVIQFERFVHKGRPGARFVYHTGILAEDKETDPGIAELALTAQQLADAGHVLLCQRRVCDGAFDYLAVRR